MAELEWDRNFALEQSGDDEDVLAELLVLFRDSSLADLDKINEGIANQSPREMADAAHSIKGAAASLGVEAIRRIASEIEQAGRAGQLASADQVALLSGLLAALDALS